MDIKKYDEFASVQHEVNEAVNNLLSEMYPTYETSYHPDIEAAVKQLMFANQSLRDLQLQYAKEVLENM